MAGLKVLSLFDGMSCAQLALQRAGIPVETYYASELDRHAIAVTQSNFPKTVQLGDVTKVDYHRLGKIDLLVGGSPCQGFSTAGLGLNFKDPRSKLFFVYFSALMQVQPKYFLLENVKMKKEHQDVISNLLGVQPIQINSSLVSAQNRIRLYWTNIPGIQQPADRKIYLKDIVESGSVDKDKSYWIDANYYKGGSLKNYLEKKRRQIVFSDKDQKSHTVRVGGRGSPPGSKQDWDGIFQINPDKSAGGKQPHMQDRVYAVEGKSPALTADFAGRVNVTDPLMYLVPRGNNPGGIRAIDGKVGTLSANAWQQNNFLVEQVPIRESERRLMVQESEIVYRKLTVKECERLQTVPEGYTKVASNTQAYKMLGNGFTVEVIAHILRNMEL